MDNGKVRFRWKDYRDGNRQKTMTWMARIRPRFLIHVLPDGFTASDTSASSQLSSSPQAERCRELLGMRDVPAAAADYCDLTRRDQRL